MNRLLHIDASPRGERSHSRRLTREFVETWKKANPINTIVDRDLGRNPIPHVSEDWIAAAFTPENERSPEQKQTLRLSDELVDELLAADIYVMGVPMYNGALPVVLRHISITSSELIVPGLIFPMKTQNFLINLWYRTKKCLLLLPVVTEVLHQGNATINEIFKYH